MTIPLFSGTASQTFTLSLSGSVASSGSIVRTVQKVESGSLASSGTVKRAGALGKIGALVSTSTNVSRALTKAFADIQSINLMNLFLPPNTPQVGQVIKFTTKPVTPGSIGSSDSLTPVKNAGPGPPINMNLADSLTVSGVLTTHKSSFVIMNLSGSVSLADVFSPVTEGPIIIEVDDYVNFYLQGRFSCTR